MNATFWASLRESSVIAFIAVASLHIAESAAPHPALYFIYGRYFVISLCDKSSSSPSSYNT